LDPYVPFLFILLGGEGTILPVFADIPAGSLAEDCINTMFYSGITTGCNQASTLYCATDTVRRWAMAAFIARAFLGMQ
jgi:hypothetical protein